MKKIDRTGLRYGRVTVLEERPGARISFACRCDCGEIVVVRANNLVSGNTISCGCARFLNGRTRELPDGVLFDERDRHIVNSENWFVNDQGYVLGTRSRKRLHCLIMRPKPGFEVDHISGNKLDNRRSNLRVVLHIENARNLQLPRKNNKSGHRGVTWSNRTGKWIAQAKLNGKNRFLGHFDEAEEAARVAREWRLANMPGALS